jgi:hypothetical protein
MAITMNKWKEKSGNLKYTCLKCNHSSEIYGAEYKFVRKLSPSHTTRLSRLKHTLKLKVHGCNM